MGSSLINGFSDIIAAPNLSVNGAFRINQRNNFQTLTAVSVNDYVSDAWKVASLNIDYCEVHNDWGNSSLRMKGYGKKGQIINIENQENSDLGAVGGIDIYESLTSRVTLYNVSGVPLKGSCEPTFHTSGDVILHNNEVRVKSGEEKAAVHAVRGYTYNFTNKASVSVELEADGEFDFYVRNFAIHAGAYRNPPSFAPVPYADDLARAERYFQVGEASGASYVPFRTKMSGTPTITLSSGSPSSITTNGFVTSGTGVHTWTAEIV